jgi:hypothetical protein
MVWGIAITRPQDFHCLKLAAGKLFHGMESKQRLSN